MSAARARAKGRARRGRWDHPGGPGRLETELDVLPELADAAFDLAIGVVDVKSSYLESAADVAARAELVLRAGVPADQLTLVPDCGLSQTACWAAVAKLRALVAGRDLLLGRSPR